MMKCALLWVVPKNGTTNTIDNMGANIIQLEE